MANMIRFAATGFAAALRFAVLGSFVLAGTLGAVDTAAADDGDSRGPLILREQGNFFVGGAHNANGQIVGQMYVEYRIPQHQEHPFPIILVHGGGQIGAGGLGEPIVAGLALADTRMILSGALPAAALALAVDGVLAVVERLVAPAHRRRRFWGWGTGDAVVKAN